LRWAQSKASLSGGVFCEEEKAMKRALLLIGVATLTVGAKNKDPNALPAPQAMTASDKAQGSKAHPELVAEFGGAYGGAQSAYVTKVGQKISLQSGLSNSQGDFTITLLNSSVNNAFAVPGGYVYVTRQLLGLMNNEAELASVMGHEVGHVAARHAKKRQGKATMGGLGTVLATVLGAAVLGDSGAKLGQQIGSGIAQRVVLGFSRAQEYQADDLGVSYLSKAGYDSMASSTMLAALAAQTALDGRVQGQSEKSGPAWASTHPDPASRVTRAAQKATAFGGVGKEQNRDAFLAALDGMMYDDDPKQGVVDGLNFRHPDLRLAFAAPPGFALSNGTQAVTIAGSSGQAQFSGGAYDGSLSSYIGAVFKAVGGQTQLAYGDVRNTDVNGIKAAWSSATANTQSGSVIVTVFAYEFGPKTAYHFVSITPAGGASNPFDSLYRSMRRLSDSEAAAIRPRKIDVVTVKNSDTVASLSSRMAYPEFKEDRFRVLNALGTAATLKSGQKVKIVTY
jgi:predicted Zn-dependent protease